MVAGMPSIVIEISLGFVMYLLQSYAVNIQKGSRYSLLPQIFLILSAYAHSQSLHSFTIPVLLSGNSIKESVVSRCYDCLYSIEI